MKKKLLFYAALLLFLVVAAPNSQASWQAPVYNYSKRAYDSGTQNWQIDIQKNGWVYFANNNGLLEFDGANWQTFKNGNGSVVRSVKIASDGTIFAGATDEIGRYRANAKGELDYERLAVKLPTSFTYFKEIWNIFLLDKKIYFQSRKGLLVRHENGAFDFISAPKPIRNSCQVGDNIYIATGEGVYILSGKLFIPLKGSELIPSDQVSALEKFKGNQLLIGTNVGEVFVFDGKEIKPFRTSATAFLKENQLFSLASNDKYIAFGTVLNGLVLTDLDGNNPRYVNNENGLQNNTILTMKFDQNNNLWLGLDNGIDRIDLDSPVFVLYGATNFRGAGYASFIDGSSIYLGTNQGLYKSSYPFDPSQRLTQLSLIPGSQGQVWKILKLRDRIYCCHNKGLFELKNDRLIPIFSGEGVWDIQEIDDRLCIVGGYGGLYLFDRVESKIVRQLSGYSSPSRIFHLNRQLRRIYVATEQIIEEVQVDVEWKRCRSKVLLKTTSPSDRVRLIRMGSDVLVAKSNEIYLLDTLGKMVATPKYEMLLGGKRAFQAVKLDQQRNCWLIEDNKLKYKEYHPKTNSYNPSFYTIIDLHNVLIGEFIDMNTIGGNQIILGNLLGFSLIRKNQKDIHPIVPFIRKVYSTTIKDSLLFGESYDKIPTATKVSYSLNSIRLLFSSNIELWEGTTYSYKLESVDKNWSEWNGRAVKEYAALHEGKYTFRLRVKSQDGRVGETSYLFEILPPWYRSYWMFGVYLLLLLLAAYMVAQYIHRRYRRAKQHIETIKNKELKQQERHFINEVMSRENEIFHLKNEQLELELKVKSKEMGSLLLNQINKNEILTDLKSDVKKIQGELQEKHFENAQRKLISLQNKLSNNIGHDVDWKKFEENFDIVNENFVKKLTERYTWLTKNERKLCVFIKMGLQTKEIAPLMNLTTRGVEMLRYRIRKKMELDRADNLQSFFQLLTKESE